MLDRFFQRAKQSKAFWRFRGRVEKIKFNVTVKRYTSTEKIDNTKTNIGIWWKIVISNIALFPFVGAVITIFALHYLDPILLGRGNISSNFRPDDADYITFMATVSGIGGVFIGLYYTAVMSAASVVYSNVKTDIRNLLINEKYGNIYMRFLAYITVVSIALIGTELSGYTKPLIAVPFVGVFCIIWVVGFVTLGRQAFQFFDPSTLSPYLFQKIQQAIQSITSGGHRWHRLELQNAARSIINNNLEAVEVLAATCQDAEHLNTRSYRNIIGYTLWIAEYFVVMKRKIPTESGFYSEKYIHKDWYRSDDTSSHMASVSKTLLRPETVKDHDWFERRIDQILFGYLSYNLDKASYHNCTLFMQQLNELVQVATKYGELSYALDLIDRALEMVLSKADQGNNRNPQYLQLVTSTAFLSKAMIVVFSQEFIKNDKGFLREKIAGMQLCKKKAIYSLGLPSFLLAKIEDLSRKEINSRRVYGSITPIWYVEELLLIEYARYMEMILPRLLHNLPKTLDNYRKNFHEQKLFWVSGSILQCQMEMHSTASRVLNEIENVFSDLWSEQKLGTGYWPQQPENLGASFEQLEKDFLSVVPEFALVFAVIDPLEDFPDFAGMFLSHAGDKICEAAYANRPEVIVAGFKPYFWASLEKYKDLHPKDGEQDHFLENRLRLALAPIQDVVYLSGYLFVFSELYENETIANVVTQTWDEYLTNDEGVDPQKRSFLVAALNLIANPTMTMPRFNFRFHWEKHLEARLREVPTEYRRRGKGTISQYKAVVHNSPLIRRLIQHSYGDYVDLMYDGLNIFAAVYLRQRLGEEDVDWRKLDHGLWSSLERDNKRDHDE